MQSRVFETSQWHSLVGRGYGRASSRGRSPHPNLQNIDHGRDSTTGHPKQIAQFLLHFRWASDRLGHFGVEHFLEAMAQAVDRDV